jgi:hypothetical protein
MHILTRVVALAVQTINTENQAFAQGLIWLVELVIWRVKQDSSLPESVIDCT